MTKVYTVELPFHDWECEIEINLSVKGTFPGQTEQFDAERVMKESVEFWAYWESRLEANNGDYTKTFLQLTARSIYFRMCKNNYSISGLIKDFADSEGWYPMDGSMGVRIISADDVEHDDSEFIIKSIKEVG